MVIGQASGARRRGILAGANLVARLSGGRISGFIGQRGHAGNRNDGCRHARVPIRLTYDLQAFGSRGNWINPLPLLGVFGAVADRRRQVALPLLFISLCIYGVWFFMGYQVARMLLPATALLSVPAADVLIRFWRRFRIVRYPIGLVVALSAGVVIAVGFIRAERYLIDPAGFLERETMHYADRLDEQASRPFASSRRDLVQNLRIFGNSLDDVVAELPGRDPPGRNGGCAATI